MRTHLKGVGGPIPLVALPDPNVDTNFPPQTFVYEEDGIFNKTNYESLGYTHFEAWCVGAAGGKGGPAGQQVQYFYTDVQQQMPGDIWTLDQELTRIVDFFTAGEWDHLYSWSHPSQPDKQLWTAVEMQEANNPSHTERIRTFTTALLLESTVSPTGVVSSHVQAQGGGGGGGGLHVVSGALVDLPIEVSVVVGDVGVDAPIGQNVVNGLWTPIPEPLDFQFDLSLYSGDTRRMYELYNFFDLRRYKYPNPVSFALPQTGGAGGASKFGTVAEASGGAGGGPSVTWPAGVKTNTGLGGAGGVGNQEVAGGGAAGSVASTAPGADGTWDGIVGKGGGGGVGGANSPGKTASHGGRGSYSFADPSVHGPRQPRSGIIPGGGGGATIESLASHYGSKAINAKPGGVVFIRLIKVN